MLSRFFANYVPSKPTDRWRSIRTMITSDLLPEPFLARPYLQL